MNDLWYVEYEAKIMLVDTVGMRPDTELAHRRLCDVIWATGEAPMDDDDVLPDICRVKAVDWVRVKGELKAKGWISEGGRFLHRGASGLVTAGAEKIARRSAAGRAGAAARHGKANADAEPEQMPTQCDRTATAPAEAVRKAWPLTSTSESAKEEGSDKASKPFQEGGVGGKDHAEGRGSRVEGGTDKPLRGRQADIAKLCEAVLNGQWVNDAGKWVERIRENAEKVWRCMSDVKNAASEGRIKTTAGQMAEFNWKKFK